MRSNDQLRQRVAFALSEILVVSDANNGLRSEPEAMVGYYDLLLEHTFGNYRDLLEAVTLSPVMGTYLSHLGNEKADEALNIRPDENYARRGHAVFTIGLDELKSQWYVKNSMLKAIAWPLSARMKSKGSPEYLPAGHSLITRHLSVKVAII
eukprot:TRINITY_DN2363_c0_g1_i1.p1 TRINITY_DN2363_c0_g1~~TRINITY_DN2363_c0_g1_i1.p1  ORF type:complete len:152 (-),score=19.32 TRINITY_DN2363_c0_g1_i1:141-596(-)